MVDKGIYSRSRTTCGKISGLRDTMLPLGKFWRGVGRGKRKAWRAARRKVEGMGVDMEVVAVMSKWRPR